MPIDKKDFMRWCDKCKKTGKVTIVHEKECWDWKGVVEREVKTCPKCLGKKIFFHQGLYTLALEERVEALEAIVKIKVGREDKLIKAMDRKLEVIKYRLENGGFSPDGMAGMW